MKERADDRAGAEVCVVKVTGRELRYMKTKDAIVQRHVSLDQVAFHEMLGKCFGRQPQSFHSEFKEIQGVPERYL